MYKQGKIYWKTLPNQWWQKIFINHCGEVIMTYHYKLKCSPPCKVIEINTGFSRRLSGFRLIEKDLRDTLLIYDEYLKTPQIKENMILIKALTRAIVITYGKCFVNADGRKIKLLNKNISVQNKDIHEQLMEMRNQYVAHAGIGYETCKEILALPPQKKFLKGKDVQPFSGCELSQHADSGLFKILRPLLDELHEHVNDEISKILTTMKNKILLAKPESFYNLFIGRMNKVIIN